MLEVSCVRYTPRAWDTRSLKSMLNGPLYFGLQTTHIDCFKPRLDKYAIDNNKQIVRHRRHMYDLIHTVFSLLFTRTYYLFHLSFDGMTRKFLFDIFKIIFFLLVKEFVTMLSM